MSHTTIYSDWLSKIVLQCWLVLLAETAAIAHISHDFFFNACSKRSWQIIKSSQFNSQLNTDV